MTITKQIIEELKTQDLTSIQLSEKLNVSMDQIVVYLNRLLKTNSVKRITNKKPFVYSIERPTNNNSLDTQLLKRFLTVFVSREDIDMDFTDIEFERLKQLKEEISKNA